jgi:hypothetical protein
LVAPAFEVLALSSLYRRFIVASFGACFTFTLTSHIFFFVSLLLSLSLSLSLKVAAGTSDKVPEIKSEMISSSQREFFFLKRIRSCVMMHQVLPDPDA